MKMKLTLLPVFSLMSQFTTLLSSSSINYELSTKCTYQQQYEAFTNLVDCSPRDTLVSLELPLHIDAHVVEVIPSKVMVRRCTGGCHLGASSAHSCVPAKQGRSSQMFDIMMRKASENGYDIECANVTVEVHSECDCGCDEKKAKSCSIEQEYDYHLCQCRCTDSQSRAQCLQDTRPKYWDEKNCGCFCRLDSFHECSTGFIFDALETCE